MNITIFCNAGVTTGILVSRMKQVAHPDDEIHAYEIANIESVIVESDVVLLAPQLKSKLKMVSQVCKQYSIPCAVISVSDYNINKYESIYKLAKNLMNNDDNA